MKALPMGTSIPTDPKTIEIEVPDPITCNHRAKVSALSCGVRCDSCGFLLSNDEITARINSKIEQ